jgi:hypothetical protein
VDTITRIARFFEQAGYTVEPPPLRARLFLTRRGRGLGPFFPFVDYVFVHDLDDEEALGRPEFERVHQAARAWAGTQFRLPRALRYRIPVVVTIGVTEQAFPAETIACAEESKLGDPVAGGEKHSTYLFDAKARVMYGQAREATDESILEPGTRIRVIREPYFGRLGHVTALPPELQPIPTGASVRVLEADLDDGEHVVVPRANVEIIQE